MPRPVKGSPEAKAIGERLKQARIRAKLEGRPPQPKKTPKPKTPTETVSIPIVNNPELDIPEFFAQKVTNKSGTHYRLVNPLTKSRNLSTRNGETSIKIVRKPVADAVLLENSNELINLNLFKPKDREIIHNHFKIVDESIESNYDGSHVLVVLDHGSGAHVGLFSFIIRPSNPVDVDEIKLVTDANFSNDINFFSRFFELGLL